MKKIILSLLMLSYICVSMFAQRPSTDPKHENHFRKMPAVQKAECDIEVLESHAQQTFCLEKIQVTNKTNDYLVIDLEDFVFKFDHGTYSPKNKRIVVAPKGIETFVIKVTGAANFHVEKYSMSLKEITLLSTVISPLKTDLFQVPANKNTFTAGGFIVNLLSSQQTTKETLLEFECKYDGLGVGMFNPSSLIFVTDKGEWANEKRKNETIIMEKGDKEKFVAVVHIPGRILDMQFANMNINWKETFKEPSPIILSGFELSFELDPGLTNGKNQ